MVKSKLKIPKIQDSLILSVNGEFIFNDEYEEDEWEAQDIDYCYDSPAGLCNGLCQVIDPDKKISLSKKRNIVVYSTAPKDYHAKIKSEIIGEFLSMAIEVKLVDIQNDCGWYFWMNESGKYPIVLVFDDFKSNEFESKLLKKIKSQLKELGIKAVSHHQYAMFLFESEEDANLARLAIPKLNGKEWTFFDTAPIEKKAAKLRKYLEKSITIEYYYDHA